MSLLSNALAWLAVVRRFPLQKSQAAPPPFVPAALPKQTAHACKMQR